MIHGHGDDLHRYADIRVNFSSNVYAAADHSALLLHLSRHLERIASSYPEPEPISLQRALAQELGYHEEQILVTSGATEGIYLIAHATSGSKTHIIEPTFSEYRDACLLYQHALVDKDEADTVWLCSPNNPTGQIIDNLLGQRHTPCLEVIDRSYQYFCRKPITRPSPQEIEQGNRLYIHSLTKQYRIPGLRLGYVVGPTKWISRLKALRQPWSVNALALEAGTWIVQHHLPETIERPQLWAEADRLQSELQALSGYEVTPSDTHFFLIKTPHRAHLLKEYLAHEHKLLIRDASNFEGLSPYHIRIATQAPRDNDALLSALSSYSIHHNQTDAPL